MNVKKCLILGLATIALVGCSKDKAPAARSSTITQVFSDSAVTAFEQTEGSVAMNKPSLINYLIGNAVAIDGNISCVNGTDVSFDLTAMGAEVEVDTTCNSTIDLSIRRKLLESLAGKRMLFEWAGGHDARSEGRIVTFNPAGSFWGTYGNIVAGLGDTGQNQDLCRDKLTFNESTGQVTIEYDEVNSGADTDQACLDSEFPGATANDYKKVLNFRFKDGKMEFDPEGTDFEQNDDYNRVCIDQNADGNCD